jgi:hypothetical protein
VSSLSSTSTTAEVQAAYDTNASYAEDNSLPKVRAFITAVRILLRRTASNVVKGSNQVSLNLEVLEKELARAQAWFEARDPDANIRPVTTRADFRNFRS